MSDLVAILCKVRSRKWDYERNESIYEIEPIANPLENRLSYCTKHGRVIFFRAEECPACEQISNMTFADV